MTDFIPAFFSVTRLNVHLEDMDRSANETFDLLTRQYAEREGEARSNHCRESGPLMRCCCNLRAARNNVERLIAFSL